MEGEGGLKEEEEEGGRASLQIVGARALILLDSSL